MARLTAKKVCELVADDDGNDPEFLLTLGAHAQRVMVVSLCVCLFVCPILISRTPTLVAKNKVLAYNTRYYLQN